MTVSPIKMALRPEMAELGTSFASIFSAENSEGLNTTPRELMRLLRLLIASDLELEKLLGDIELVIQNENGATLQDLLEALLSRELDYIEISEGIFKLSNTPSFQEILEKAPNDFDGSA